MVTPSATAKVGSSEARKARSPCSMFHTVVWVHAMPSVEDTRSAKADCDSPASARARATSAPMRSSSTLATLQS